MTFSVKILKNIEHKKWHNEICQVWQPKMVEKNSEKNLEFK